MHGEQGVPPTSEGQEWAFCFPEQRALVMEYYSNRVTSVLRGGVMADRKQFLGVAEANSDLQRLLIESSDRTVTEEELREQRISFAFGSALNSSRTTKDSVRHSSQNVRLFPSPGDHC
jgi:hypothetical protein